MKKSILILFSIIFIQGCEGEGEWNPYATSNRLDSTTDARKIHWMNLGQDYVRGRLKDPQSAQFRNVFFNYYKGKTPLTCGEVNSKNSLGGYVGFKRFVTAGNASVTFLEQEVRDFDQAWRELCPDSSDR